MMGKIALVVLLIIVMSTFIIPEEVSAIDGFWSEQLQVRIDVLGLITGDAGILPFLVSNIFSVGLSAGSPRDPVFFEPYVSIIVSGAISYEETTTIEPTLTGFAGGGASIGARIAFLRFLSVKPELTFMLLKGTGLTYITFEFAADAGFYFGNRRPWGITLDVIRVGLKPYATSLGFLFLLNPTIGITYTW